MSCKLVFITVFNTERSKLKEVLSKTLNTPIKWKVKPRYLVSTVSNLQLNVAVDALSQPSPDKWEYKSPKSIVSHKDKRRWISHKEHASLNSKLACIASTPEPYWVTRNDVTITWFRNISKSTNILREFISRS